MEKLDYIFKTEPYEHQRNAFFRDRDAAAFGYFWEMGTGKSKITIDSACWLYGQGKIDMLIVVAPNGVHENWVTNEVVHIPDHIEYRAAYWTSTPRAAERKALEQAQEPGFYGLRIITINIEAISKPRGKEFLAKLLRLFRCMLVLDESSRIKTPGRKRTRALINLAPKAKYRRILTGTSITSGILDLYAQMKFLDPYITGYTTFGSFKARYALLEKVSTSTNRQGFFEKVVGFQNVEELLKSISPFVDVQKKKDCVDLPEKIYEPPRWVSLSTEQKRVYKELVASGVAQLQTDAGNPHQLEGEDFLWWALTSDDVNKVAVENALTSMLRLQQCVGGFMQSDAGVPYEFPTNPRMDSLMELIEETSGKVIIWARFKPEIKAIVKKLKAQYGEDSTVAYFGEVSKDDRRYARTAFQEDDKVRFFVGQPHSGGIGLTLTAANTVIYYSNDFSLETRLQSEDRAHRIGQRNTVAYIDLVARGTLDTRVRKALQEKEAVANAFYDDLIKLQRDREQ